MHIIDCCSFFDEFEVLDLRLNYLSKFVDKFIITEGCYDHRGLERKTLFNINKFSHLKDKIIYLKIKSYPNLNDPWHMLRYQRNYVTNELKNFSKDDLVMISDVDEIPRMQRIENYIKSNKKFGIFKQKMFYYRFNYLNINEPDWFGTRICKLKYLKSPDWLRGLKPKKYSFWRFDKEKSIYIIDHGGWHFSFLYDERGISKKLSSYQHTEFDNKKINNLQNIKNKINNMEDILGRGYKFKKIKIDSSFPDYLSNNKSKFKKWIAD